MDDRHLRALVGERHPITAAAALRRVEGYLTEQFRALGLQVSSHSFEALEGTYRNVIATMQPSPHSPAMRVLPPLIVAGHYDTVEDSPGADDNASALAVLLEVAHNLLAIQLNREVRFIAFCLEEENLLGSLAYASWLRKSNQEVSGAIVLECVGYARPEEGSQRKPAGVPIVVPSVGDFLAIVGNQASSTLVASVESASKQDVPDLKTISLVVPGNGELFPDTRRSDHAAFWHYGYPAVMLTDTANYRNPNYHRSTDTLDTLDLGFLEKVARAVTATVIQLCSMPPIPPPAEQVGPFTS